VRVQEITGGQIRLKKGFWGRRVRRATLSAGLVSLSVSCFSSLPDGSGVEGRLRFRSDFTPAPALCAFAHPGGAPVLIDRTPGTFNQDNDG
jgi:hypothetical protein